MEAFLGHVDFQNPAIAKCFPAWINFDVYDKSYPFHGHVWAARQHLQKIQQTTKELGEANFVMHALEDVVGEQPNFNPV